MTGEPKPRPPAHQLCSWRPDPGLQPSAPSSAARLRLLPPWEGGPARSTQKIRATPHIPTLKAGRALSPEDRARGGLTAARLPPRSQAHAAPSLAEDTGYVGATWTLGPWGHMTAAVPALSSSRHPAPSGSERGRAGPGLLIPQSSLQARLAGMCWARPSPGTTHPWEPCPALGAAVREWVHQGWPEHPAKLGTSAPPAPSTHTTLSSFIKGNSSWEAGGDRHSWSSHTGQAHTSQGHAVKAAPRCPSPP